jgi:hypothetical protein
MCDGYSWVYAVAAAAAAAYGSKTQADAANDAADKQAAAMNAAMEQQDQFNRKAEGKALENADQYDMTDRTQRFEDTRQQAGDSLAQSLIKSREEGATPDQSVGKLSESFTADRASKMADQFQQSVDNARLMGNMRGTQDMIGNEAIMNADYASQLNTIGRNANGSYNAAQPGILQAGKVDSGKVATGALLQSLGTSYLSGAASSGLGSAFGSTSPTMSGAGTASENWIDSGGLMNSSTKSNSGSMFNFR